MHRLMYVVLFYLFHRLKRSVSSVSHQRRVSKTEMNMLKRLSTGDEADNNLDTCQ